MSLILVVSNGCSTIMASDRREVVAAGGIDYHRDNVTKLTNLTNYIGILSAGNYVGFTNWLLSYFVSQILPTVKHDDKDADKMNVLFSQFLKREYEIYTKDVNPSWLFLPENSIEYVTSGYTLSGELRITRFTNMGRRPPFAPELWDHLYYFSGKDGVAYYLARKQELEKPFNSMSTEELKQFAIDAITETASVDDHVSPPIDMVHLVYGKPTEKVSLVGTVMPK